MRLVYLDDSGTSDNESITVIAGVIINPDKQWRQVVLRVYELIEEYIPQEYQAGFVFRATHLFHGSHIFDRKKYPMARRLEVLRRLVEIPAKFGLSTIYGYQDKKLLPLLHKAHPKRRGRVQAAHDAVTYSLCAIAVEKYMREHAAPEELATITVENSSNSREAIKKTHDVLKGRYVGDEIAFLREVGGDYLPIHRIVDCINFASKDDAILLQLADACAFVFRCYLENKPHIEPFCDALTNNNPALLKVEPVEGLYLHGYKILYSVPKSDPENQTK